MHLPHLLPFGKSEIVFITTWVNGRQPLLANAAALQVIREIWGKSAGLNGWFVGRYILMSDHIHLFASPANGAIPLTRWMQLWKAITAKQINRQSNVCGTFWQPDYFDRYIRSLSDYTQKWDYISLNPVRGKLVNRAEDWPFQGTIHDLQYHGPRDW